MKSALILVKKPTVQRHGDFKLGVRGHFHVELIHARTGLVKQVLDFDNLIVDVGLDHFAGGLTTGNNPPFGADNNFHMAVGTGSTPPATTDTALEAYLAGTNSNGGFGYTEETGNSSNNYTTSRTFTKLFGTAEANGNLTEVGVYSGPNSTYPLFSRALFVDETDTPVAIVKTSEDQLRITYTLYIQFDVTETQQVGFLIPTPANPAGVSTLITNRGSGFNLVPTSVFQGTFQRYLGGWANNAFDALETNVMPAVGVAASGVDATSVGAWSAYIPGTFYRERECSWGASAANFATGIGMVVVTGVIGSNTPSFYSTFDPKVPKTNTDRFVYACRVHLGRAA